MLLQSFLKKQISVGALFGALIIILLCAYAYWEIYWFTRVGLSFIKWHTHFAVFVYLWILGAILLLVVKNKAKRKNFLLAFSAFVFALFFAELALHLMGITTTYIENRIGSYQSVFNHFSDDSIRSNPPSRVHHLKTDEYDYVRYTNNWGFSDKPFLPKTSKTLIQTYGDSFTEGDGASADSSYPAILKTLLGQNFDVQNYGICGNDPGFYVTQFGKVGSHLRADLIVLCYGTGDFQIDVLSRGGVERFCENGWRSRNGPWYELIYGLSYVSRLFFHAAGYHYNSFFMTEIERSEALKNLQPAWIGIFEEVARLAKENNTKVLLFKKPERYEVVRNKYDYDMAFFDSYLKHQPIFKHVDLLPYYRSAEGMNSYETTAPYYWAKDGHHNSTGYRVMAMGVHQALQQKFPELFYINTKVAAQQ